jgi:hypothetical protein
VKSRFKSGVARPPWELAACGFSGVLYKVITSPQVLDIVKGVIGRAFKLAF